MRKSLQFTVYSLQFFVILFIFGAGLLFFAPTKVESSHGQAGPVTTCGLGNFQNIPDTVTANTPLEFTATFSPALSTLLGRICIHKAGTYQDCGLKDGSGNLIPWGNAVTSGTTYNYSFTPTTEGVYKVFCSSSNANDYECRGATQGDINSLGGLIDSQGRTNNIPNHPCEGGTSSKGFTVTAAAPAAVVPAVVVPAQPPESTPAIREAVRRTGDIVHVDFSATDKSGSGIKEIVVSIWEGAANAQEKWFPVENAPEGKRHRYEPIQNVASGTREIKIPSFIEYYAVDNQGNKESNGQGKAYLVNATDDTKPSTTITLPGSPGSYIKKQLITLKYISDYDRQVGLIRRKAIRVTEDITLSAEAEIQNYISTHQDAWNQARTVEMRPNPPQNHVEMDDLEPIRIPAVVEYFAIGEDDRSETKKYAFIAAPISETTSKVRIAESQAELESCITESTCQDFNYNPTNIYSYKIKTSFGQKTIYVRYISNAGNTRDETGTITYAPLPDCSNLAGPGDGFVGQELTYSANFAPPANSPGFDLKGDIAAGTSGGDDIQACSSKNVQGECIWTDLNNSGENNKQMTLSFSQPGNYKVFCRSLNNSQFVECRGNGDFVSGSANPRVRNCASTTGSKTVNITKDEIPPTTTTTINPATNINRGSNVAVTLRSSDTQSKVRTVFVGIWKNKASKAEATGNPDVTCEYGNTTNNCPGASSTTLQDGAVQITFNDIPVPSYIETNAIDYSGNQERNVGVSQISQGTTSQGAAAEGNPANAHLIKSDDIDPPTSLVDIPKASGAAKYNEELDINFTASDRRGVHAIFAMVWEGRTTKPTTAAEVATGKDVSVVGGGRTNISETKKAKAPFYLEYHAEDINGKVEEIPETEEGSTNINNGRRAHFRSVDVDKVAPAKDSITVSPSKTSNVNNGDEVTLDITTSDNQGGSGIAVIHTAVWEGVSTEVERNANPDIKQKYEGFSGASARRTVKVPSLISIQAEDASKANPPAADQTARVGNVSDAKIYFLKSDDTDPPTSSIAKVQLKARGSDNFVDINPSNRTSFGRGDILKLTFKANDKRDKPGFSATKKIHVGIWRGVSTKEWNPDDPGQRPAAGSGKSFDYLPISPSGSQDSVTPSPSPSPAPVVSPSPAVSPQPDQSTTMTYTCIDNDGDEDTNNEKFAVVRFLTPSSRYAIRVDNKTKSAAWSGCNAPESGDWCDENITQNQKEFYAGNDTYDVWYHTVNGQGNFSPASEHMTVTCPKLQRVLGVSSQTGEATETIEVEAPFYLEYHAEDINGNEENKGQTFSSFSAPLDGTAPEVGEITIENQPTDVNVGTEVDLKFTASDDAGGSGLKTIHTAVWEGVASRDERNAKITALGLTYDQAVTLWKDRVNVNGTPAQNVYLGVANNATRKAKVPFYAEARAEDNCNCVPKTGGGFTGNITTDADTYLKSKTLDHNDQERPTGSTVTVKGAVDPSKTSRFAAGEQVELTFTSQDHRGVRVIHTGLWEGFSTKEEAIQRSREQGKDFENWLNGTDPSYQGVANNGKRTATVPFYLEYVAEDINGNIENVSIPPGVDDSKDKTPGGVHAFAIEIPTVTEKIRIVEGERGLLDTCDPATCEKPFNSADPKISHTLSSGAGNKTIWVRFINNKRRDPVTVSKTIRRLATTEGVTFEFVPASVTKVVGSPGTADFVVKLNAATNLGEYNISAVDINLSFVSSTITVGDFVPNSTAFAVITNSKTSNNVHFLARRSEGQTLRGLVELGTLKLNVPSTLTGSTAGNSVDITIVDPLVTSSDVIGSVPIARPIAKAILTLALASPSPSPSPSAPVCLQVLTWARNSTTRECRQFETSCLGAGWVADQSCAPSGSASPSPSPSASPGAALACDFNKNGRYDEGDNDPLTFDDLQIWTEATLGRRSRSGITQSGFSWDADCASDPDEGNYTSKDERVDLIDLNRWLRLKQGFVETP